MRMWTTKFKNLFKNESGVTLVEYGITVALAIGLGTAALSSLGSEVGDALTAAGTKMPD